MNREILKGLIELIPEEDEIEAIAEARRDQELHGTVPHEEIEWE